MHVDSLVELEQPLFGQLLRQVAKLRTDQLEACLQRQRQEKERLALGQILLREGLITREQIREVLRLQARWVAATLQADMAPEVFPADTFLSLCLPAFNEEVNLPDTLDAACTILPELVRRFEVIVVDDGSSDGTWDRLTEYAHQEPRVRPLRHPRNQGYGAAVTTGLRAAAGDLVAFTDSDGQFSLLNLPWFLCHIKEYDVVIGYRYRRADPWHRRWNAWAWNRLVRVFLGVRVRDLDCAFKVFRREVIDGLRLTATGAAINAEILAQCVHGGRRIRELPVAHYPRYHGSATGAAWRVIVRAFRELPQLGRYRLAQQDV
jgi:glycosyltransferase involved in cell wall biosynthesis